MKRVHRVRLAFFLIFLNLGISTANAHEIADDYRKGCGAPSYGQAVLQPYGDNLIIGVFGAFVKPLGEIDRRFFKLWLDGDSSRKLASFNCGSDMCTIGVNKDGSVVRSSSYLSGDVYLGDVSVYECKRRNGAKEERLFRFVLGDAVSEKVLRWIGLGSSGEPILPSYWIKNVRCFRTRPAPKDGSDTSCWFDLDTNGQPLHPTI